MARLADLTTPEVGAAASFHRYDAKRQRAEKLQHLRSPQLLSQNLRPRRICAVNLETILGQIKTDRDNLRHNRSPLWILADPPWHIDAVGGRALHHQRLANVGVVD
jgi:hypothetical protein